jgi:DNA-nicking Smr family endonuclease
MATLKDFSALKGLRDDLKEQERVRAIEKAEREKREKKAREEANVFKASLGGVQKMKESDRYVPGPKQVEVKVAKPASKKFASQADDDADVMKQLLSDEFGVEHVLEEDPNLSYSRPGVGPDVLKKLRKRHWPVQDELDLHGMNRDAARGAVTDFLLRAEKKGQRCVRIIHGKGFGSAGGEPVLRSIVHSWLVQKNEVVAFCVASRQDGGHGALIVLLNAALVL